VIARRKALFVDLDGTVRDTKSGRVHPVKPWDQVVLPNVEDKLREYRDVGYMIVGVTNQGGVAFGYLTEEDVIAINRRLADELLPGLFDARSLRDRSGRLADGRRLAGRP
jgi:histidinol phosphatase-like enzyme